MILATVNDPISNLFWMSIQQNIIKNHSEKCMFSEACHQLFIYIVKCFWGRGYVDICVSQNTIFIYPNLEGI